MIAELNLDAPPNLPAYSRLRGRQADWLEQIDSDFGTYSRLLAVAPGGVGKSTVFAALAERIHSRSGRTLVLENRDRLVGQTAKRLADETGLEVDVEMGSSHASPFAPIVVASVQTLGRTNRLTGFSDSHFQCVIPDEAHYSTAPQWLRILHYFHYGAGSLAEEWIAPEDGTYIPQCLICAFTATPDIGERRSLMEFYQHRSVDYSYLEAIAEGWLVGAIQKCIPVKIDTRKLRVGSSPTGVDFNSTDISAVVIPVIEKLADQIVEHASDRKTMAFLPSVECARLHADAIARRGLKSIFVSGECIDADEKADDFAASGPGTVLSNAVIYHAGVDFPDVDCVAWYRATLSKAFYIQGIYRGTRVLPNILDGLTTPKQRLEAIAASAKRNLLVLDPLFVSDRIDLCDTYDLFAEKPEIKEKMKALGPPSPDSAEKATRDFIKALEKEAKKHAKKQARIIDPVSWAMELGDEKLASYVPERAWEMGKPTDGQLAFIRRQHLDPAKITNKGLAQRVIGILMNRLALKLATPVQLDFLKTLGASTPNASTMTAEQASEAIDEALEEKRGNVDYEAALTDWLGFIVSGKVPARVAWRILSRFIRAAEALEAA